MQLYKLIIVIKYAFTQMCVNSIGIIENKANEL